MCTYMLLINCFKSVMLTNESDDTAIFVEIILDLVVITVLLDFVKLS